MTDYKDNGGGLLPKQRRALIQLRKYAYTHWWATTNNLHAGSRQTAVYVLQRHYGFTQKQLSQEFDVSIKTIRNDVKSAYFLYDNSGFARRAADKLYDYIKNYNSYRI